MNTKPRNCKRRINESANPTDDNRVFVTSKSGSGSLTETEDLRDTTQQKYSDLFHRVGIGQEGYISPNDVFTESGVDFTPPATSFKLSEADSSSDLTGVRWNHMKQLHHDTGLDFTEQNRSSKKNQFSDHCGYCECVVQTLEAPDYVTRRAIKLALKNEIRGFNPHYEGYLGTVLAFAVLQLADSPEEFFQTHWFDRLEDTIEKCRASFEATQLVELAFKKKGGLK